MWGPGPWMWGPPGWGFGWIFPLIGLLIALVCLIAMIRFMGRGGGFMCMGGHGHEQATREREDLERGIRELREEVRQLKVGR